MKKIILSMTLLVCSCSSSNTEQDSLAAVNNNGATVKCEQMNEQDKEDCLKRKEARETRIRKSTKSTRFQ